jgi:hypothetical protein
MSTPWTWRANGARRSAHGPVPQPTSSTVADGDSIPLVMAIFRSNAAGSSTGFAA